jgi:hypothetical protein
MQQPLEDQTDWQWLGNPSELGTGMFLVLFSSYPERPPSLMKLYTENITHPACTQMAYRFGFEFMKWVPHRIAGFNVLAQTTCSKYKCNRNDCKIPGCMCDPVAKRCK